MSEEAPKCDKCGVECTTGMMAAYCSKGRDCEFWPHSNGEVALAGAELLMYRFWMDNTLEQIGLQIEDRNRLERELAEARHVISDGSISRWILASERHPEFGQLIAVRYTVDSDTYDAYRWADYLLPVDFHYWMPLPEAPK